MNYDSAIFAQRLLISRRDLSLDQKELGRRANVSNTYISDLERGRVTNPGIEVVSGLANALGVSIEYLLGLSDDPDGSSVDGELGLHIGDETVVYEIEQPALRTMTKRLVDLFLQLPSRDQQVLVSMAETMANIDQPRIIGE